MTYSLNLYNLQVRKKHLQTDQELKFTFPKMLLLSSLHYQHCQKHKTAQSDIYYLQTRLFNSKTRKNLKT